MASIFAIVVAAIATYLGASIVTVIIATAIATMIAYTCLYKIDPFVELTAKLLGIDDEEIIQGNVASMFVYDRKFYKSIVVKNVLNYTHKGLGAKEYVLEYAKYGDNIFRRYWQTVKLIMKPDYNFRERLWKRAMDACENVRNVEEAIHVPGIKPKDMYERAKQTVTAINDLKNNKKKYLEYNIIPDVTFELHSHKTDNYPGIVMNEMGKSFVNITSAILGTPTDEAWCKWILQKYYGYVVVTDTVTIDGIQYSYKSTSLNLSTRKFDIILESKEKKTKRTVSIDPYKDMRYLYIQFTTNKKNDDVTYFICETTDSDGMIYAVGEKGRYVVSNHKGYSGVECFPFICFKSGKTYLTEGKVRYVNEFVNPFTYQLNTELLKSMNLTMKNICDHFSKADANNDFTSAFLGYGVPITAKMDGDGDDFEEPEVLSKILFQIFSFVLNQYLVPTDYKVEPYSQSNSITRMTIHQKNYYAEFDFLADIPRIMEGHIGKSVRVGRYYHKVYGLTLYKIYDIQVRYTGRTGHYTYRVLTEPADRDKGTDDHYETFYDVVPEMEVVATEYIIVDHGNKNQSSVTINGSRLPANGYSHFHMILDKPLSSYIKEEDIFQQRIIDKRMLLDDGESLFFGGRLDKNQVSSEDRDSGRHSYYCSPKTEIETTYGKDLFGSWSWREYEYYGHKVDKHTVTFIDTSKIFRYAVTPNYTGYWKAGKEPRKAEAPKRNNPTPFENFASNMDLPASYQTDLHGVISYYDANNDGKREYSKTPATQAYMNDTVPASRFSIEGANFCRQLSPTQYMSINILSPSYWSIIRENSGEVSVAACDIMKTSSDVVIPLPVDLVFKFSLQEKVQLVMYGTRIIGYYYVHIDVPWYQTEGFASLCQFVCLASAMAINVVTFGQGMNATNLVMSELLSKIALKVAVYVGLSLCLKMIAKWVDNPYLAGALSVIAAIGASYVAGGFSFPELTFNSAVELSATVLGAVSDTLNQQQENEMKELQQQSQKLTEQYTKDSEELKGKTEQFNDSLLTVGDVVNLTIDEHNYVCNNLIFDLQGRTLRLANTNDLSLVLTNSLKLGVMYS